MCISATQPMPPRGDCPEMRGIFHLLSITNFLFRLPVLPVGSTINTLAFNLTDSNPAHNPDWVSRRVWWLSRVAKPCPPPPTHRCLETSSLDETHVQIKNINLPHAYNAFARPTDFTDQCTNNTLHQNQLRDFKMKQDQQK